MRGASALVWVECACHSRLPSVLQVVALCLLYLTSSSRSMAQRSRCNCTSCTSYSCIVVVCTDTKDLLCCCHVVWCGVTPITTLLLPFAGVSHRSSRFPCSLERCLLEDFRAQGAVACHLAAAAAAVTVNRCSYLSIGCGHPLCLGGVGDRAGTPCPLPFRTAACTLQYMQACRQSRQFCSDRGQPQ